MNPETEAALAAHFERFAQIDGRDDALYVALAHIISRRPELLGLLQAAPPTQRLPVLLLAALHQRVLAGAPHAFLAYYASRGGSRAPDAELESLLLDFTRRERAALQKLCAARGTQTNEIGRCAVLWPVLQAACAQTGVRELALYDFGCSAGLNLGVDAYTYQAGAHSYGHLPTAGHPQLAIDWRGPKPANLLEAAPWRITQRAGSDLAPLDPSQPGDSEWLQACQWPSDGARHERLQQALALALQRGAPLLQSSDGLSALKDFHERSPAALAGVQPVLFHSWVLAYFDAAALRDFHARALALVQERGWWWISAEALAFSPLSREVPEAESPGSATLWTLHSRRADGSVQAQALAWSHPHGRWGQWLGGALQSA